MTNIISVVQNIAALRGMSGVTDGDVAAVDGYYAEGDQGGGMFVWISASVAADDGGIFITPMASTGAGRWQRIHEPSLHNVRWYGAAGDGTTNDTAAIQAAINYVSGAVIGVSGLVGGSGYTSAPSVSFSGGNGTGATATAIVSGGAVTGILITSPGGGYTSAPSVSLSGGGGTGASAQAVSSPGGGTLFVPSGVYSINATLNVYSGVRLTGAGWGENGTNSQGNSPAATQIIWSGSTGGTMILIMSPVSGAHVYDAAIIGLYLDGKKKATYLALASSTIQCEFDFAGTRAYGPNPSTVGYCLVLDGNNNNALSYSNRIRRLLYSPGVAADYSQTQYSVGLVLDSAGASTTVNYVDYVVVDSAPGINDYGIWIRSDNNTILHCQADLTFKNDPSAPGRNNRVLKATSRVRAESVSHGNYVNAESEDSIIIDGIGTIGGAVIFNGGTGYTTGTTVTFSLPDDPSGTQATGTPVVSGGKIVSITMGVNGSGYTKNATVTASGTGSGFNAIGATPTLHYQVVSYTNGGLFETPKFLMRGSLELGAPQFAKFAGTPTLQNTPGNHGTAWNMPNTSPQIIANMPAPFTWNNGTIVSVDVFYVVETPPGSAQNWSLNTWVNATSNGALITSSTLQGASIPVPAGLASNTLQVYRVNFSSPVAMVLGDFLGLVFSRPTGSTYTGDIDILAARINYVSAGPYLGQPSNPTFPGPTFSVPYMAC